MGDAGAYGRYGVQKFTRGVFFFFFFTLLTGPRRSLSLKLRDTRVYAPQIRVGYRKLGLGRRSRL